MIGRDSELAQVVHLFGVDGAPGLVLAGQAGVGKSRLAAEAVRTAADAGWTVRRVHATATSRLISLGAFARWTDDAGGEASAVVRRVVDALIAGRPGRTVVLVDDAHLLDDLSALVLHHLVQSRAATVIVTIRAGEPAPAAVTALWKEGLLRRFDLEALSRATVDDLLSAAFGSAPDRRCGDELWRLTRGNALFLRELAESEHHAGRLTGVGGTLRWQRDAAVSDSLADLVDAQIGAVDDELGEVVDVVAVSEPVGWHCLRLLADQDAIERAEQRGLIRIVEDQAFVGHPMYAEVRIGRCASSRLRRLRGRVAAAMKDDAGAPELVKRGLLWLDSDLPVDADVVFAAATAANSLLDFATALRLYTAVADTDAAARARVPLAFSLFMMERGQDALDVLADAEADDTTPGAFINDVVLRASNVLWAGRSPEQSWEVIEHALQTAHGVRRQQLLVFRANQLALAARPTEVLATMADIDLTRLDSYGATMGYGALSMANGELGRCDQAVASAGAADRALSAGDQGKLLRQTIAEFHVFALIAAGRLDGAVEVAERHRRSQRAEPEVARLIAAQILGMVTLAAGDLSAALQLLPAAVDADMGFNVVNSFHRFHLLRAQALARSGKPDAAGQALRTARAHRHPAYVYVTSTDLLTEAWLRAARSRSAEARHFARAAADFARNHDQFAREVWCLQTAVQFDDTDATRRLTELGAHVAGPRVAVATRYAAAVRADDADALGRVSFEFEAMGDRLAAADAAGQAATSYRRSGRTGSAMSAAARSQRLAIQCGGATSPAIAAASFGPPLTAREREIAVMVAEGLSNRQIAEAMSLSVRTVESHLYRASAKAGVAGRAALAELMREAAGS